MNGSLTIEEIDELLVGMKIARAKLQHAKNTLQERYKNLFQGCVTAQTEKNKPRAIIYANEAARVQDFSARLTQSIETVDGAIQALLSLEEIPPTPNPV